MTRVSGARKKIKESGKVELEAVLNDVEMYGAIASIADQDGGQVIMSKLQDDVVLSVEGIAYNFETLTHEVLVAKCAKLRASLDLYLSFKRAGKNRDDARKFLKDAMGNTE